MSRALTLRKGLKIDAPDICFEPGYQRAPPALVAAPLELPEGVTLEQMMQQVERQLILSTVMRCNGNKALAAQKLGLARSTVFKRLKEWGLGAEDEEAK